jgi:hypothetical protein
LMVKEMQTKRKTKKPIKNNKRTEDDVGFMIALYIVVIHSWAIQ